jgi:hypothetical protein
VALGPAAKSFLWEALEIHSGLALQELQEIIFCVTPFARCLALGKLGPWCSLFHVDVRAIDDH